MYLEEVYRNTEEIRINQNNPNQERGLKGSIYAMIL
jgi:hypothetical protein